MSIDICQEWLAWRNAESLATQLILIYWHHQEAPTAGHRNRSAAVGRL